PTRQTTAIGTATVGGVTTTWVAWCGPCNPNGAGTGFTSGIVVLSNSGGSYHVVNSFLTGGTSAVPPRGHNRVVGEPAEPNERLRLDLRVLPALDRRAERSRRRPCLPDHRHWVDVDDHRPVRKPDRRPCRRCRGRERRPGRRHGLRCLRLRRQRGDVVAPGRQPAAGGRRPALPDRRDGPRRDARQGTVDVPGRKPPLARPVSRASTPTWIVTVA